jgi:3-oxoacyl-[acyl-carrier protein] reductase
MAAAKTLSPQCFDTTEQTYGGIDVVVHAATKMSLAPLVDLDLAELDSLHRTNIRANFLVGQQAARRLRAGGAIITCSSSVVGLTFPRTPPPMPRAR